MYLDFIFLYNSQNALLQGFLQYYAKHLAYNIKEKNGETIFSIEGSHEELTSFCELLKGLSLCIFLKGFEVKAHEQGFKKEKDCEKISLNYDNLSSLNASVYLKQGLLEDNEFGLFCSDIIEKELVNKNNFKKLLENAIKSLKAGLKIRFENDFGVYELGLFEGEFDLLMPCVAKNINKFFACNEEKLKLLASFEKPVMELKFNAIFRANHKDLPSYAKLFLAPSLFLYALGLELENEGFLAFKLLKEKQKIFEVASYENKLVVISGQKYLEQRALKLIEQKEDKRMAKLSYLLSRYGEKSLLIDLEYKEDDIFLLEGEKELIDLSSLLELDSIKNIKELILKAPAGERLLANYEAKFQLKDKDFKMQKNLFSLFELLAHILGLKNAYEFLQTARACKLNKGVLIDFELENYLLNPIKTIRSFLSFRLAGIEDELIALSTLHSLAFFIRDLYDDLKAKSKLDSLIVSGELFKNPVLMKAIVKQNKDLKLGDIPLVL